MCLGLRGLGRPAYFVSRELRVKGLYIDRVTLLIRISICPISLMDEETASSTSV